MAVSMYDIAIPTFQKQLGVLDAILDKAGEYAAAKKIDHRRASWPRASIPTCSISRVRFRLATDFAKAAPARLAGARGAELSRYRDDAARAQGADRQDAGAPRRRYKPEQFEGSETQAVDDQGRRQ